MSTILDHIAELSAVPILTGAAVLAVGELNRCLMKHATEKLRIENQQQLWHLPTEDAGMWIGGMERVAFYLALLLGQPKFIAAWMAFKLATKWNAWSHVVRIGDGAPAEFGSVMFDVRHRFSSWLMSRFSIGTLLNILVSLAAAFVYAWARSRCF